MQDNHRNHHKSADKSYEQGLMMSQQDIVNLMRNDSGMLLRGCFGLMLYGMVFMFGFVSLSTFVLSRLEASFFQNAARASGVVTQVDVQEYREPLASSSSQNGNASYVTKFRSVLSVSFTAQDGAQISAKMTDSHPSLYSEGSAIEIAYDPQTPGNIKDWNDMGNQDTLLMVSKITFAVFLVFFALAYLMTRQGRKQKMEDYLG